MAGRLAKWLLICALVLSIGGHWALLQSVAWVGMAISYSQEAPVTEALVKTFDGKHPCKLCKFVRDGKKSESKEEGMVIDLKKIDFFSESQILFCFEPTPISPRAFLASSPLRTDAPPTPPPLAA